MTARIHSNSAFRPAIGIGGIFGLLVRAHQAWLQRRALSRLDDAALSDLGLTRSDAAKESERPIWDVPPYCKN